MGKVDFLSQTVELPVAAELACDQFSDLNNFQKLVPEQIVNWQSAEDYCSFDIKGMAHIDLKRTEVIPGKLIRIGSGPENALELELRGHFEDAGVNKSTARIELTAELNPMLKMMVSGPLQNLVNIMAEKLVLSLTSPPSLPLQFGEGVGG